MSLNLGPVAFEAIQRLKNTEDWRAFVTALTEQWGRVLHGSLEAATPETSGYARGLRDVVWAIEIIEAGPNAPNRAAIKPTPPLYPPSKK